MAALDDLKLMTDYASVPAIDESVLTATLANYTVGAWVAATAYAYGERVAPVTANGRIFVCISAGTSDLTEPDWPDNLYGEVDDGDVTWREDGPIPSNLVNLKGAAFEIWRLKSAAAAAMYDFDSDDQSFSRDQLMKHCATMMAQYAPYEIGGVSVDV